jgi:hypothetical protein
MSQKKRLEILRCVVLLKVFSKKRSFFGSKNSATFTVGNHFESKSARNALLCRSGRLLFCYNSAKLKRKHFRSEQRRPIAALLPPIPRRFSRPCRPFHGRAAFMPHLCRFCPPLARQRMAAFLPPSVLNTVLLDALNINSY